MIVKKNYCKDCNKVDTYIIYIGIFSLLFIALIMILQVVLYLFYVENKQKIQKVQIMLEEIFIFLGNILIIINDAENVIDDINKLGNEVVNLAGDTQNIFNALLDAVTGPGVDPPVISGKILNDGTFLTITGDHFVNPPATPIQIYWPAFNQTIQPTLLNVLSDYTLVSQTEIMIQVSSLAAAPINNDNSIRIVTYGGVVPNTNPQLTGMYAAAVVPSVQTA